jgi:nucleotide-binding universal stress UspA family protein
MNRILVPLDASDFGEHALGFALALHEPPGELHLLSIVNADTDIAESPELQSAATRYLEDIVQRLPRVTDVRTEVRMGEPGMAVSEYAREIDADLVIAVTHGRGLLGRLWLGSVADDLVRKAPCPVLLTRPADRSDPIVLRPAPLPDTVAILLDGTSESERALRAPVLLGLPLSTRLLLIHVVQPPALPMAVEAGVAGAIVPEILERDRKATEVYLDMIATQLRRSGFTHVITDVAVDGKPADASLDRSQVNGCQLIAVATQARAGLSRLLVYSVADQVIRSANVPVLVFRLDEDA